MDIKDIHKFCIDENAWYHVILPSGTSNEDLMGIREFWNKRHIYNND